MSERYIEVDPGDRVTIYAVPKVDVPPTGGEDLAVLIEIPPVTIFANSEGTYVHFVSDLDVCTDGSGEDHGDDYHQNQTAYYNKGAFLNADEDMYTVVPQQVRSLVVPTVMGCQARVTNIQTGKAYDAVVGDIGPKTKTGECAICLAQLLNPSVSADVGDSNRIYLYELWPGRPAVVDGKQYKLEAA